MGTSRVFYCKNKDTMIVFFKWNSLFDQQMYEASSNLNVQPNYMISLCSFISNLVTNQICKNLCCKYSTLLTYLHIHIVCQYLWQQRGGGGGEK